MKPSCATEQHAEPDGCSASGGCPQQAQIAHAVAGPAGLVGQGTGQPGFTDTGGAADAQVETVAQPLATAQLQDQRLIQPARAAVVDVFDAGVVLEPGLAQAATQALVVAVGQLAVDQQANEPFVLACRRDHPLAKQPEVAWRELSDYRLIGVGRLSGNRVLLDHGLAHLDWRPSWFYEVQHLSTSLGMVEAGLGIAALPSLAMPAEDHPILVSRPLVDPVISRTLGLVRRRGSSLSPAAEQFVETLLRQWPSYTSIGTSNTAELDS